MQLIRFECPHCDSMLKTKAQRAGDIRHCPKCEGLVEVPKGRAPVPEAKPARRKRNRQNVVPVGLKMPHGLGGMQAKVTQGTANTMAKTFLGGILVAIGVALAALIGSKSKQA